MHDMFSPLTPSFIILEIWDPQNSIDGCLVDIRLIKQGALLTNSSGIILAHNHPSGNLKPSTHYLKFTKDIKCAGDVHKIKVMDHIILTSSIYTSLADEGLM